MKNSSSKKNAQLSADELFNWQTDRRSLLRAALITGAISQIGFLSSCKREVVLKEGNDLLTAEQATLLYDVMNILFPNDGNGPNIDELNSFDYIMWVLKDEGANKKFRDHLKEGIEWTEEMAVKFSGKKFLELNQEEKERAVEEITQTEFGKEWCSIILTYILESLLLDPVYHINPDGIGWKWLNHTPGYPQSKTELSYENILDTVRSEYNTQTS